MRSVPLLSLLGLCSLLAVSVNAAPGASRTRVAMTEKSAATFYVSTNIAGVGAAELMVDTGSGYVAINEVTLATLKRGGHATYLRQLQGILADGTEMNVPVYRISGMSIGQRCWLANIEVAVFPGNSRQILGLSALRKAAPFVFSVDPPELQLSQCAPPPVQAAAPAS